MQNEVQDLQRGFDREVRRILEDAENGGVIRPRRAESVKILLHRVRKKYGDKIKNLHSAGAGKKASKSEAAIDALLKKALAELPADGAQGRSLF